MLYHAAKFEKNPHSNIGLHNFGLQLGKNCLSGTKEKFLGNFTQMILYLLIVPYHAAKFEKNPLQGSCDISLHNFVPQSSQNCTFGPKENVLGILLK